MTKKNPLTAEAVAAAAAVVGLVEPTSDTSQEVIDLVDPDGAEHRQDVPAEDTGEVQYTLDPQMVQQAMQNKNARLIAMMVNENAMLEVALEQERRAHGESRAKLAALQQAFGAAVETHD